MKCGDCGGRCRRLGEVEEEEEHDAENYPGEEEHMYS